MHSFTLKMAIGFGLVVGGLTLTSTGRAQGTIPLRLRLALTATVQGLDDQAVPIARTKTTTTQWTAQTILSLTQSALGTEFPSGAYLAVSDDKPGATVVVMDKNGVNILTNLTTAGYFSATGGPGAVVQSGQDNVTTGQASGTSTFVLTLSFNDKKGNSFSLTGVVIESYSFSAGDINHNHQTVKSQTIHFVGTGTVLGKPAVFSGNVSARGKGIETF